MARGNYEMLEWKNGGRWDIWAAEIPRVRNFIKEHNLTPLKDAPFQFQRESMAEKASGIPFYYPWPWGGMKIAHLHFGRDIYLLNEKQWRDFSNQIMDSYKQKLANVKTVSFDQLMDFSDAVGNLG